MAIRGHATEEGTLHYRQRFQDQLHPDHFRQRRGLYFSSIGCGTYLGHHDEATDRSYEGALAEALARGCNVFDTAINYRCMRSERAIGRALARALENGFSRQEVIISTKGGFIPFDGEPPSDPGDFFYGNYVAPGLCGPDDVVAGCHCMAPGYLQDQLERSLENLGLGTVDIYYLHNPETQLGELSRTRFQDRMRAAFDVLEEAARQGKIGLYGTATWNGYRVPSASSEYLSLVELQELAREVGGEEHHFRVVQLPYNLALTEALTLRNQRSPVYGEICVLDLIRETDMVAMTSASLGQGQLAGGLPPFIGESLDGLQSDAQRALQFVRSTPGVTTALVGMKQAGHVAENLCLARLPAATREEFLGLFRR